MFFFVKVLHFYIVFKSLTMIFAILLKLRKNIVNLYYVDFTLKLDANFKITKKISNRQPDFRFSDGNATGSLFYVA